MRVSRSITLATFFGFVVAISLVQLFSPFNGDSPKKESDSTARKFLSVEQTIGLAFLRLNNGGGDYLDDLFRYANPEANPILRKIFADQKHSRTHENIARMLGCIGDENDLKLLEKLNLERNSLESLYAIGQMARRKIPGADDLLDRMISQGYWDDVEYELVRESLRDQFPFEYGMFVRMMCVRTIAGKSDVEELSKEFLSKIKNPSQKKHYQRRLSKERMKFLEFRQIDNEIPDDVRALLSRLYEQYAPTLGLDVRRLTQRREQLSVEETIGSVFSTAEQKNEWLDDCFKRANPKAKNSVSEILDKKDYFRFHANAITILGYIGGDDDAKKLEQLILERYREKIPDGPVDQLDATFKSLGRMACRDVKEASDILDRMLKISYWTEERFGRKRFGHWKYFMFERVAVAATIARKANLEEICADVLTKMPEEYRRAFKSKYG